MAAQESILETLGVLMLGSALAPAAPAPPMVPPLEVIAASENVGVADVKDSAE
jgi:hypothetical protein